jgi:hypothetical protein
MVPIDLPELGLRIRHPKLGQLSQRLGVLFLDSPTFLSTDQLQLRLPFLTRHLLGGPVKVSNRTCSQSAISLLSLLMRLTRSVRTTTAWPGWRLSYKREREREAKSAMRLQQCIVRETAYQHSRVFSSRDVFHYGQNQALLRRHK